MKASALGALSCAVASAGLLAPADAFVRAGHTVFVLPNDSIVEAEGYRANESVLIQVKRGGVVVGSARASSPDGAVAVNHDSCWDKYTPVIRPGDVVEVTSSTGKESVPVTGIELVAGPAATAPGTVTVRGKVTGALPPVDQLQAELRSDDPIADFRALAPNSDTEDGPLASVEYDNAAGDFTVSFTGLSNDEEQALLNAGEVIVMHAPSLREMTIATGASPVAGPGCGIDAPVVSEAVSAVTPQLIGRRNAGATIRVQGFSENAAAVTAVLRDQRGRRVTVPARLSSATGSQTWRASVTATKAAPLNGRISVRALVDGTAARVSQSLLKDLVAPKAPTPSLSAGTYRRTQFVSLNTGASNRIRYTLGNGTQPRPTVNRGRLYQGGQLRIARTTVLKMIAVDPANNVSPLRRLRYVIR